MACVLHDDGDEAGAKGAAATAAALRERGVDAGVVVLPDGADVNSLVVEGVPLHELNRLLGSAGRWEGAR